jgi:WD40 repeat protein
MEDPKQTETIDMIPFFLLSQLRGGQIIDLVLSCYPRLLTVSDLVRAGCPRKFLEGRGHYSRLELMGGYETSALLTKHTGAVRDVCYLSPTQITSVGWDNVIRIWDTVTLKSRCCEGHQGKRINHILPIPSLECIVTAGDDKYLKKWHATTGDLLLRYQIDATALAFHSTEDMLLLVGSGSGCIDLIDPVLGDRKGQLSGRSTVRSLVSLQRDLAASGNCDNTISIWALGSKCLLKTLSTNYTVQSMAVLSNGLLACGSWDGKICIWDYMNDPQPTSTSETRLTGTFSRGERPRYSSAEVNYVSRYGIRLHAITAHKGHVLSLRVLSDGITLFSTGTDGIIKMWDTSGTHQGREASCITSFLGHENGVDCLAVSPDEESFASGSFDHTIRLWRFPIDCFSANRS